MVVRKLNILRRQIGKTSHRVQLTPSYHHSCIQSTVEYHYFLSRIPVLFLVSERTTGSRGSCAPAKVLPARRERLAIPAPTVPVAANPFSPASGLANGTAQLLPPVMKFVIRVKAGAARAATLSFPRRHVDIPTPALLLYTRRGAPIHLTPDVLQGIRAEETKALLLCTLHFLESPSFRQVAALGGGIHEYANLERYPLLAVARDSLMLVGEGPANSAKGASFDTPSGRRQVDCRSYMEVLHALRPDLCTSLPDEVAGHLSSRKRSRMSVARTLQWLDECLALRTAHVPEDKLRFVCGLSMPEDVLQGVACGVDLFDTSYPHDLTLGGLALVFPLTPSESDRGEADAEAGADGVKINLRSATHRLSTSPLLPGCTCYACQHHSRAYIHHLLNAHEMLAEVLLNIHNTHHYLGFFKAVREAVEERRFEEYHDWFVARRRNFQEGAIESTPPVSQKTSSWRATNVMKREGDHSDVRIENGDVQVST